MKKGNDEVLAGKVAFTWNSSCMPGGVPGFMGFGGPNPTYFLQTSKQVVIIHSEQFRHVYLDVPHSENPKPSWYGESVGHYEGDTLVVDTIGFNGKAFIDRYGVPYSEQLHMIERYRVSPDGKAMQAEVTYDDPKAYTTQWKALIRYRLGRDLPVEVACAESPVDPVTGKIYEIPIADKPDF
jgi:hypothetical protein